MEIGKWYLFPTGCSFQYECDGEMEHYYFRIKLYDFDETDLLCKCGNPICIDMDEDNSDFMQKCVNSKNILDGLFLQQIVLGVLLPLIQKYNIDIKTENFSPCVLKAIRYIKENLSVQLTISEIAENIFVSKSTLCKRFRQELSMSVNEYVYNLVMSKAEYMLTTSDVSIQTISEKFGFYDQFYFAKRFKDKFGNSPREYRKFKLL